MATLARITVVEHIYHQCIETDPFSVTSGFTRHTQIKEQPYSRKCVANEGWSNLDFGWMKDLMGMIVLVNETKADPFQSSSKILELAFANNPDDCWVILAGESFRGSPSNNDLIVRCRSGDCRYTIHCLPK